MKVLNKDQGFWIENIFYILSEKGERYYIPPDNYEIFGKTIDGIRMSLKYSQFKKLTKNNIIKFDSNFFMFNFDSCGADAKNIQHWFYVADGNLYDSIFDNVSKHEIFGDGPKKYKIFRNSKLEEIMVDADRPYINYRRDFKEYDIPQSINVIKKDKNILCKVNYKKFIHDSYGFSLNAFYTKDEPEYMKIALILGTKDKDIRRNLMYMLARFIKLPCAVIEEEVSKIYNANNTTHDDVYISKLKAKLKSKVQSEDASGTPEVRGTLWDLEPLLNDLKGASNYLNVEDKSNGEIAYEIGTRIGAKGIYADGVNKIPGKSYLSTSNNSSRANPDGPRYLSTQKVDFIEFDDKKYTNYFDVVSVFQVLNSALDISNILEEIHRVMKVGGTLIIKDNDCVNKNDQQMIELERTMREVINEDKEYKYNVFGIYMPRESLVRLMRVYGFELYLFYTAPSMKSNPTKVYYASFKKI
jgi:SAM-dependent methyltransferase